MAEQMKTEGLDKASKGATGLLGGEVRNMLSAVGDRALAGVAHRMDSATDRLMDYAEHGGPGLISAFTGSHKGSGDGHGKLAGTAALAGKALGATVGRPIKKIKDVLTGHGGDGDGESAEETKVTNIVEEIDIGAPIRVCYDQWTQFADFPKFMKKVETVEQESDEKLNWKAQVFWSHRTWHSTIVEQVPDERIVWRSTGDKGHVDGAVTFHELTPDMTRVILVLEYHPQGLMERTGNIWRAQGRRARLELKHFARHVMTQTVLHPDEIEGWRGEIHDGEVKAEKQGEEKAGGKSGEKAEKQAESEPKEKAEKEPPEKEAAESQEESKEEAPA
jgi:uncharacterized membrane protein